MHPYGYVEPRSRGKWPLPIGIAVVAALLLGASVLLSASVCERRIRSVIERILIELYGADRSAEPGAARPSVLADNHRHTSADSWVGQQQQSSDL